MHKLDAVDVLAVVLLTIGVGLFGWGLYLDPPSSLNNLVAVHFGDWTPGFAGRPIIDVDRGIDSLDPTLRLLRGTPILHDAHSHRGSDRSRPRSSVSVRGRGIEESA